MLRLLWSGSRAGAQEGGLFSAPTRSGALATELKGQAGFCLVLKAGSHPGASVSLRVGPLQVGCWLNVPGREDLSPGLGLCACLGSVPGVPLLCVVACPKFLLL